MKEHPILFSGPMVRAILDGRKTQTRRAVKPQPSDEWVPIVEHYCPTKTDRHGEEFPGEEVFGAADENEGRPCPYGEPGDWLWVRETWANYRPFAGSQTDLVIYRADLDECGQCPLPLPLVAVPVYVTPRDGWRPSIHMPRWASRLTLEVMSVRVERVQEISEEDARAEGIADGGCLSCGESEPCGCANARPSARDSFVYLWNSINGKKPGRSWADNPWVWVVEFKRIEQDRTDWGAK